MAGEVDEAVLEWQSLPRLPQSSMSCISFCAMDSPFGCSAEPLVCHVTLRFSRPEPPVYHSIGVLLGE